LFDPTFHRRAATRLQKAHRGRVGRRCAAEKRARRDERLRRRRHGAAVRIQSRAARGPQARRRRRWWQSRLTAAARTIQLRWREYLQHQAAIRLQCGWRCHRARVVVSERRERRKWRHHHAGATVLQQLLRRQAPVAHTVPGTALAAVPQVTHTTLPDDRMDQFRPGA
jgi:hypothetical protein